MAGDFRKRKLQNVLSEYLFHVKKLDTNFIIAKVMLDRLSEFPDISIERIAYLANTTPSSVSKFCKKIGFDGFSGVRDSIINYYGLTKEYIQENQFNEPHELYDLYANQINNIYQTFYRVHDKKQLKRIAWQLSNCKKISILTGHHGFAATNLFCEMLRTFDITGYEIDRNSETSVIEDALKESDMLFIISLSGRWIKQQYKLLEQELIKKNQGKIVILSYDSTLETNELVDFSVLPEFFDSTYISNNTIQAFFILLVSYLAIEIKTKNKNLSK